MRKLFIPLALSTCLYMNSAAQDVPNFEAIKLELKDDYNAEADAAAHAASTYLLSTTYDRKDAKRLQSAQYLIRWMSGTPKYEFHIDAVAMRISKKDSDYLALYLAAMVKYCLDNPQEARDQNKVRLNAIKLILAYCQNPQNNMKLNAELKKLASADARGELETYLNS